ncbi:MAG TPA: nuclear transport factor 2 family protein [Terriglobales bacterium]|nr:nuclear transport factor 2 family protein [Terriglobales bacterium]
MWQYSGSSGPGSPATDAESAMRGLVQDFTTAFNTGNYDQCAAIFVPEGQLMMSHRDAVQGHRGIERSLRDLGESGYQDLRMQTVRVDAAGDRGIEIGRYTASVRLPNGKLVTDRGNYLACWRRLGAWRILASCFSSSVPRSWQDAHEWQLRTVDREEVISGDAQRTA